MSTRYGTHGVTIAHAIIRSREPGVRPRSFTAEVTSIAFLAGIVLGFAGGVVW